MTGGSVKDPEKKTQEREREKVLRTRHNQLLEFFIRRLSGVTSRRGKEGKEIKLSEGNKTLELFIRCPLNVKFTVGIASSDVYLIPCSFHSRGTFINF